MIDDWFEVDLIIPGMMLVVVGLVFAFQNSCPRCKRMRALRYTGNDRNVTAYSKWGSVQDPDAEREWQCRYCGYRQWKQDPSD